MTKHQGLNGVDSQLRSPQSQRDVKETCNATTQTEKVMIDLINRFLKFNLHEVVLF